MNAGIINDSQGGDILVFELTEEEVYVARMLLQEEIYTVEDLIKECHQVDENTSDIEKQDAINMKHQLNVMKSILNKIK